MKNEGCVWLGVCILLVFCHRCNIYVSVSARMYIGCFQCVFFTSLGGYFGSVCRVNDEMRRLFFFRRAHQSPAFSPGLFSSAFFHVFFFFFFFSCFYSVILVCLCYSKVLSAFYDIKCLCQRWQDWTDGLCSTENWFCGGLTFHQLHFTLLIHHWLPSHLSRPYWSDQDRKRPLSRLGEQSSGFNLFWIFIYLL